MTSIMNGTLIKNELRRLFVTPLAWALLAVCQLILAWAFFSELEIYQNLQIRLVATESPLGVTSLVIIPAMLNALKIIMLITPLLTMRSFAAEKQQQRMDLLLASRLSVMQITLGKFFPVVILLLLYWLLFLIQVSMLAFNTEPDMLRILGLWLFGVLVIALYAAIGNWISSITRHPVVAAVTTYGILLLLSFASQADDASAIYWFSIPAHLQLASLGLINSSDLIYFVLATVFFLSLNWLAVLRLKYTQERWSSRLTVILLAISLVLSMPLLKQFHLGWDISRNQHNTLPAATQSLLSSFSQPVSFTVYLSNNTILKKQISRTLNRYKRFKPDTLIRFVDPQKNPEAMRSLGITKNGEILVRYNNKQQLVKKLSEAEITRTLVHLTQREQNWILNLQGHSETSLFDEGLYGASTLTKSLRARGYLLRDFNLMKHGQVPENTSLLIISSPQAALTPSELLAVKTYLDKGGNLLWLTDPEKFNISKALTNMAGMSATELLPDIELLPGIIVDANAAKVKLPSPDNAIVSQYAEHPVTSNLKQYTLFPQASALKLKNNNNWQTELSLKTGEQSWNETGELVGNINRDPILFEQQGPLPIAFLFSRNRNSVNQKLAIVGDSDFLRNQQLGQGDNLQLALNLFFWFSQQQIVTDSEFEKPLDQSFTMTNSFRAIYGMSFMFGIPLVLILLGFLVPHYRKRLGKTHS